MKERILIVDDEKNIRRTLGMILRAEGYLPEEADSGEEALRRLNKSSADLALLDVNLPGIDGIETLKSIKEHHGATEVIMISGRATVSIAVEATRAGAFDFLEKPLSKDRVMIAVRNALAARNLNARVKHLEAAEAGRWTMVGQSDALERVRAQIAKVGPTTATVLITGESGTGKELVARALHTAGPRSTMPLIQVNCAAIPEDLIETELFGCVAGAYTGADRDRDGKFILADAGTLFLDEIGDMSLKVQAKVLRALQEGEIQRVGDSEILNVNVRVIAATNKDLAAEVRAGRFREDLFYRLNVVPLDVPPLRERKDDIPDLCIHFLERYAEENGTALKTLEPDVLERLQTMPWRGNIRELCNVIERLAILGSGPVISQEDLANLVPPAEAAAAPGPPVGIAGDPSPESIRDAGGLNAVRREFERRCIEICLDRTGGNIAETARWLGIERSNLHKKMQTLGIEARPQRPKPENREKGQSS